MARRGKDVVALLLLGGGATAFLIMATSKKPAKKTTNGAVKIPPAVIVQLLSKNANVFGAPESLVLAIAQLESGYNPKAHNPKVTGGAWGLGQVLLSTAQSLTNNFPSIAKKHWNQWDGTGPGLQNPDVNAAMTAFMLSRNWNRYKKYPDPWLTAGLAHHQGMGNVDKFIKSHKRPDGKSGINVEQLPPKGKIYWNRLIQIAETSQPVLLALARDTKKYGVV